MPAIGPMELAIVVVIALLIFGPKQLPKVSRSIGSSLKEFRAGISDIGRAQKDVAEETNAQLQAVTGDLAEADRV